MLAPTRPQQGDDTWRVAEGGPAPSPAVKTLRSSGARSGVNLLGDLHMWGLAEAKLRTVRLEGATITPSQLKEILSRLPPNVLLTLEVDVEDTGA